MVEVRGRVEGYIEKWLFRPGAEVNRRPALYVLDLRPYEAAVQQAKGNLHQSEADLEFARNRSRCCRRRPTWPPRRPTWSRPSRISTASRRWWQADAAPNRIWTPPRPR